MLVAGIYFERDCAWATVCPMIELKDNRLDPRGEHAEPTPVVWGNRSVEEVFDDVANLIRSGVRRGETLDAIAVASYGPFRSLRLTAKSEREFRLTDSDNQYGIVDPERADPPLRGQNVPEVMKRSLKNAGFDYDIPVVMQTDANLGALGAAYQSESGGDDVIAYILLTEGVGGGFVCGRTLFGSALHPEMGLLHVRTMKHDPLKLPGERAVYGGSLQELVAGPALRLRASRLKCAATWDQLLKLNHPQFWPVVAEYVAQAAWACTALLGPTRIIVGGPYSEGRGLMDGIRVSFDNLREERKRGPLFALPGLDDPTEFIVHDPTFVRTGLRGCLHWAWQRARVRKVISTAAWQ